VSVLRTQVAARFGVCMCAHASHCVVCLLCTVNVSLLAGVHASHCVVCLLCTVNVSLLVGVSEVRSWQ
jgi:hypothetical protein